MKKEFTVARPKEEDTPLVLKVNGQGLGIISPVKIGTEVCLILTVYDDQWSKLPIIAADLYCHAEGAHPCGYANHQAARQAAKAILSAHGWQEVEA